ncbi:hypothetical protein SDC9_187110 [bioreactor metagenome]|uniref:Uncharacterized protein n=1 Tax=bioreactor metagenome TaxID=1076179 RepID=A0A645HMB2_9ZZZZ
MQIPFDQLAPFCLLLFGYLRVSIPGKIHQIQFFIDIVKIDGLGLSRSRRYPGIGLAVHQRIDQ